MLMIRLALADGTALRLAAKSRIDVQRRCADGEVYTKTVKARSLIEMTTSADIFSVKTVREWVEITGVKEI